MCMQLLTHWGRVTHICVGNLTIIAPDNGLSPGRRQAIIWTNAGILFIGPWGTNFSEILIGIHTFSFKKIHLKMSSAKWSPFCLGLNVLSITVTGSTDGNCLRWNLLHTAHSTVDCDVITKLLKTNETMRSKVWQLQLWSLQRSVSAQLPWRRNTWPRCQLGTFSHSCESDMFGLLVTMTTILPK